MGDNLSILKETFELKTVDTTCSLATCSAWNSMDQLNLVTELEEAFDSIEPEDIGEMINYKDIVWLLSLKGLG